MLLLFLLVQFARYSNLYAQFNGFLFNQDEDDDDEYDDDEGGPPANNDIAIYSDVRIACCFFLVVVVLSVCTTLCNVHPLSESRGGLIDYLPDTP